MRTRHAARVRGDTAAVRGIRAAFIAAAVLVAAGCVQTRPYVPPSEGHIVLKPKPAADPVIPPPARISSFVPPPQPAVKPQTYSVVVNEVPVKELLNALARDTRQNIDIHPSIQGLVSLNAIDETLPAILERISRQVNIRYRVEGNTINVSPDSPYMKTYRVNYVNVTRNISSTVNVTGEVGSVGTGSGAAGGAAAGSGGGGTGGGATGGSRTTVTSTTSNDFWEQLRDNIRAILMASGRAAATADERARVAEENRAAREEALKRAEIVSRAGAGAAELMRNAFAPPRQSPTLQQSDTGTDVIINPISGTISVQGTEKQHQLVQQHLDNITNAVQRQVLIEATIVEVRLSDAYQAGVDLRRIATTGGFALASLFAGAAGAAATAAGAVAGGLTIERGPQTGSSSNIGATIRLLQEFGNTRVLSSPKVMAINNQTALLKHVDNIVYFEVQAQQAVVVAGGPILPPTFTTTAKTVAVGVVLGVTPQINEDGRVTLTVRPTVSRLLGPGKQDPNPSLCGPFAPGGGCVANVVPEVQVREMESVLQVASGQTIILGGLMEDDVTFNREQIPVVGDLPGVGEAFRFRNERAQKRELIIFIRPTVISHPSLDSDELKFFQRFLPNAAGSAPLGLSAAP